MKLLLSLFLLAAFKDLATGLQDANKQLQGGSWKSPWHRYTYCRVGGTAYGVGEPMPSSDVCKTGCVCGRFGRPVCELVDCPILDCPPGNKRQLQPHECCFTCVPVVPWFKHCFIDGKVYHSGETIPSNDPCQKCTCWPGLFRQRVCVAIPCVKPATKATSTTSATTTSTTSKATTTTTSAVPTTTTSAAPTTTTSAVPTTTTSAAPTTTTSAVPTTTTSAVPTKTTSAVPTTTTSAAPTTTTSAAPTTTTSAAPTTTTSAAPTTTTSAVPTKTTSAVPTTTTSAVPTTTTSAAPTTTTSAAPTTITSAAPTTTTSAAPTTTTSAVPTTTTSAAPTTTTSAAPTTTTSAAPTTTTSATPTTTTSAAPTTTTSAAPTTTTSAAPTTTTSAAPTTTTSAAPTTITSAAPTTTTSAVPTTTTSAAPTTLKSSTPATSIAPTSSPAPTPTPSPTGCVLNCVTYSVGDPMPFDDPCHAPCVCDTENKRVCQVVNGTSQQCGINTDLWSCPFIYGSSTKHASSTQALSPATGIVQTTSLVTTTTSIPSSTSIPTSTPSPTASTPATSIAPTSSPAPTPTPSPTGCVLNCVTYSVGNPMPFDDPCHAPCVCGADNKRVCQVVNGTSQQCGINTELWSCPFIYGSSTKHVSSTPALSPATSIVLTTSLVTTTTSIPSSTSIPTPTPSPTGCVLNGVTYSVGDPMPFDNPCHAPCVCGSDNKRVCQAVEDCPFSDCPRGKDLKFLPDQCCPICEPHIPGASSTPASTPTTSVVLTSSLIPSPTPTPTPTPTGGCVLDGVTYPFGEPMPFVSACRNPCICGGQGIRICIAVEDCPFSDCPRGQELKFLPDQCCPICEPQAPGPSQLPFL